MAVKMDDVVKLYVALFGRAPEGEGASYWYQQAVKNGWDIADLANSMYSAALSYDDYSYLKDPKALVESIYENVLGKSYEDDPAGIDYWTEQIESGKIKPGEVAKVIVETAENYYPDDPATKTLENRVELAKYVADKISKFNGDFTEFKKFVELVNADPASIEKAKEVVDNYLNYGADFVLTDGKDMVEGTKYDDKILAPLVQNKESGQVVNSLDSGDFIDGGAGNDTLVADVSYTTNVGVNFAGSPAMDPTVKNVEKIELTAQYVNQDVVNSSNLDAQNISGVKEYWDVNSRANIQIEDIRQLPEELTFGVKDTDPGTSFNVFFDPQMVSEGRVSKTNSTLTLVLDDLKADDLSNFKISGIVFKLDGVEYKIENDNQPIGTTYEEFASNLQKLIDENPELKDRIKVEYVAPDKIVLTDLEGGTFEPVGYEWVNNAIPAEGELKWDMIVGSPIEEKAPVTTTLILDNVGRTSQGGIVDIGSMGDGGIQEMNIKVDHDSWLTGILSKSDFGNGKDILETVKLSSLDSKGHLYVGNKIINDIGALDGRVVDGFINVKDVLNDGFEGELKYGVRLDDDAITKYLDDASDVVTFTYEGGEKNDNITIKDASTNYSLSADPFFGMKVSLGEGDDRLNLDVANVKNVEVDGGEGNNLIAVKNSHGTTVDNTFKVFKNFNIYEIEATKNTEHEFDSMSGVKQINVATTSVDTTLIHVPYDAQITITGKNQTIQNSNANQTFGTIDIQAPQVVDDDKELTVVLDNTARYDGQLIVNKLAISDYGTEVSKLETLNLVSQGVRETSNYINNLDALRVSNFNISGSQDLHLTLTKAANYTDTPTSLTIDAYKLTGALDLTMNVDLPTTINNSEAKNVSITGGQTKDDVLTLQGTNASITSDTSVKDVEHVSFKDIGGKINVSKFADVVDYTVSNLGDDFVLQGLTGSENVCLVDKQGSIGGHNLELQSAQENSSNTVTLNVDYVVDNAQAPDAVNLKAKDFSGLKVIFNGSSPTDLSLNVSDVDVDANGNSTDISKVMISGGFSDFDLGLTKLNLNLGNIKNTSLKELDLSDFNGIVEGVTIDTTAGDNNVTVDLGKWGGDLKELNNDTTETTNVLYRLSTEMATFKDGDQVGVEAWILDHFETGDGNGNPVDANDKSIVDVSKLGINYISDLKIVKLAHYDTINSTWVADDSSVDTTNGVSFNETIYKVDVDHDGKLTDSVDLSQCLDLNYDQAIYLVLPNDTTKHHFAFLIGVNDEGITLNEDFFNGL